MLQFQHQLARDHLHHDHEHLQHQHHDHQHADHHQLQQVHLDNFHILLAVVLVHHSPAPAPVASSPTHYRCPAKMVKSSTRQIPVCGQSRTQMLQWVCMLSTTACN